jgi:tetratricopeptide (TPR) repeat protein
LLKERFRYGNLADEDVLVDHFIQYNLNASRAREGFARVAKQLIREGKDEQALEMLDRGLEVLPTSKIQFTDANTYPYLEAYYSLEQWEKGDALLQEYLNTLIEYIEYYLQFDGPQANLVVNLIERRMDSLMELYYLAAYARRDDIVRSMNDYLRTFGYTDEELIQPGVNPEEMIDASTMEME